MDVVLFRLLAISSCLIFVRIAHAQSSNPPAEVRTQDIDDTSTVEVTKVKIRVREKGRGSFIKRAEIQVGRKVFYTDPQGEVEVEIPKSGDGSIIISRFRYEKQIIDYGLLRTNSEVEIFLYPGTPGDNEVYVRGEKRPETSKTTVSASESARVAPGGDPAQVTQLLPGVQTQTFGNNIAVRGSGPNDSSYWIDNFQVFQIFHNVGSISVLPEQLLSDVEFYAGGFGPRFGNATGGVVRLLTKTEMPEEASTEIRINLPIYSTAYHERPVGDDAWIGVSARYSYLQYILPYFLKGSDSVVVPYFGDAHAMYVKRTEDGGHRKLFVMGSQDGLELLVPFDGTSREDGRASVDLYQGFATVGVESLNPLRNGWSLVSAPQFLFDRTDHKFLEQDKVEWNYYSAKVFLEANKRLSKDESIYIGYEPGYGEMYVDINAPVPSDDPLFDFEEAPREKLTKKIRLWYHDAWASIDQQLGSLIVTPGLRYRFDGQIKKGQADPRLRARFKLSDSQTIKAAYGLYSKAPDPQQSSEKFGNPSLDFVKSTHYVLGLESRWSERWETEIQLYYKTIYNQVVSDPETLYSNNGSARSKGAEVFIRRNLTERMFGWLSYTYSVTEDRESDQEPWRAAKYDQTHVATLATSYRLTATWDLGLRYTYRTGDTHTPINDAVYNANFDKYQPRPRDEDRNSERLPPFTQIDTWVTKDFLYDTWKLALRMGVQYLSFSEQVYARNYNYDYTETEDFSSVPPIPYIELRGKF